MRRAAAGLGRVAFYDEKCGDAYLTTEAEIAYRPSALTLLDDLYDVCDGVRRELDRLLGENARAAATLPQLAHGSPSAAFAAALTADTSDADIETACTLPDEHESETVVWKRRSRGFGRPTLSERRPG